MAKIQRNNQPASRSKPPRRLPLLLAILAAFAVLVALVFALRKPAAPVTPEVRGAPNLKADKEKIDLGDVKLGVPVSVSFKITNTGDQPLEITEAPYIEVLEGC